MIADCGVDDWYGPTPAYNEQLLAAEWAYNQQVTLVYIDQATDAGLLIGSVAVEPIDWAVTISDCLGGNCSPWAALGLLPFVPGSIGRHINNVQLPMPLTDELYERAVQLHGLISNERRRNSTTTMVMRAIDADGNIIDLVVNSSHRLTDAQRAALGAQEVAVPFVSAMDRHAELRGLFYAQFNGLTALEVAASRPICRDCAQILSSSGVLPVGPVKPGGWPSP